jgi:hypothetical protein
MTRSFVHFPCTGATAIAQFLATGPRHNSLAEEQCEQPVYVFKNDALVGFSVSYQVVDWSGLLVATKRRYHTKLDMRDRWKCGSPTGNWEKVGVVSFAHFLGHDVNGNPVTQPFVIHC